MIIRINLPTLAADASASTLPPPLAQFGSTELVLIELQGTLEVEGAKDGQAVGTLRVDAATKKPTLAIGHHLLEGKLANLPKPLAVLRRQQKTCADCRKPMDGDDGARTEWDVVAVVRRKMVFSKRPLPVLTKEVMHLRPPAMT